MDTLLRDNKSRKKPSNQRESNPQPQEFCSAGVTAVLQLLPSQLKLVNLIFFRNAFELQALQDGMSELKQSLSGENIGKFEDCVEVHMQHIMSGLSRSDFSRNSAVLIEQSPRS